jgi:YesN/AraC family two-component response regulator
MYCKDKLHLLSLPEVSNETENEMKKEGHSELYQNILLYFAKERPYINPDFSILQLALTLDTNISYISKAIKIQRNMNYKLFVNTFRIEYVKEKMMQDPNRYTLEHIYTSSGFKNHSTFNKAFKQIEGITPTEYYRKQKEDLRPMTDDQ